MEIERFNIIITDLITVGEIETFEDKNGNGSYKATTGHDDLIMTFCQVPMLKNTAKYKDFVEEFEAEQQNLSHYNYRHKDVEEVVEKKIFNPIFQKEEMERSEKVNNFMNAMGNMMGNLKPGIPSAPNSLYDDPYGYSVTNRSYNNNPSSIYDF